MLYLSWCDIPYSKNVFSLHWYCLVSIEHIRFTNFWKDWATMPLVYFTSLSITFAEVFCTENLLYWNCLFVQWFNGRCQLIPLPHVYIESEDEGSNSTQHIGCQTTFPSPSPKIFLNLLPFNRSRYDTGLPPESHLWGGGNCNRCTANLGELSLKTCVFLENQCSEMDFIPTPLYENLIGIYDGCRATVGMFFC